MASRLTDTLLLRRWRRKRAMRKAMRELDHYYAGESRRTPKASLARIGSILGATALVVTGGLVFLGQTPWFDFSLSGLSRSGALGHPQTPSGRGAFAFEGHQTGAPNSPITYSPCRSIHVVINSDQEPPLARGILQEALQEVSDITGLQFVIDGPTHEEPTPSGQRRPGSPSLIAWSDPEQIPALGGDVAGLGGSTVVVDDLTGIRYYTAGQVVLDAPDFAQILTRDSGRDAAKAIVLHELGHLVGLAHVDDPTQLMYAKNAGVRDFQQGDRAGLAALGSGPCVG